MAAEPASGRQAGPLRPALGQQPGLRSGPGRQAEPAQLALTVRLRLRSEALHLPPPPPQPQARSWCSSCSTAIADEPFLSRLHKLSSCSFNTMVDPDGLAAQVPRIFEVLPNTFALPVAVEGKHPEHIVDQVEKALKIALNRGELLTTIK